MKKAKQVKMRWSRGNWISRTAILFFAITFLAPPVLLAPLPFVNRIQDVYAGQDIDMVRSLVAATQAIVGVKYFTTIVQSNKSGSTGALKVTVTRKFLQESQQNKQKLMQSVYDAWKQTYKGQDKPMIAFVNSKNVMVGMASDGGCLALP